MLWPEHTSVSPNDTVTTSVLPDGVCVTDIVTFQPDGLGGIVYSHWPAAFVATAVPGDGDDGVTK